MRVRLVKGKQRELIMLAKGDMRWRELSECLGINVGYLAGDLKCEKVLISKKIFIELCKISGDNYERYIIEYLNDNWGKVRGGLNSIGNLKKINIPSNSIELAEFVGAVLGDGHVHFTKKTTKKRFVGVYQIRITGDKRYEKDYHIYLGKIAESLFGIISRHIEIDKKNERYLFLSSRGLVEFFFKMGIGAGNKIINQSTIPEWIYKNDLFLKACIRGLIDTDGSIHRMSNRDSGLLRINFKNYNFKLLNDAREAFIYLGFHPSKIINGNIFYISRQGEIAKYLKEIGFSNKKHLDRLNEFQSPVV